MKEDEKILCKVCGKNEAQFIQCEKCFTTNHIGRRSKFIKQVYKIRGKRCEMCGENCKKCLTIHHIKRTNRKDDYDVNNVKVLCLNCHFGKVHKQGPRND